MSPSGVDRRGFLAGMAAASALTGLGGRAKAQAAPTVVIVHAAGVSQLEGDEQARRIRQMLTAGMNRLTGLQGAAAWESLFKPDDTVLLKVNCLAPTLSPKVTLVDSAARGVIRAGVPGEQTLVWERTERELVAAGFTLGANANGYQVVATDAQGGHDEAPSQHGTVTQRLPKLLSERATAILNLPIIKDHDLTGFTGALKNHFGSIDEPWKLHGEGIHQAIADLNAMPAFRDKHRLVIGDVIRVVYEGGPTDRPGTRADLDSLVLATDPVAHDAVGAMLVEELRAANNLRPLGRVGRGPAFIRLAAEAGLGVADLDQIVLERIELEE